MEKTKLGLSTAIVGALCGLIALYGGYTALLLLVGYVLLFEKGSWLRSFSVGILTICLTFSLLISGMGLLQNLLSLLEMDSDGLAFLSKITYFVRIIGKAILLALAAASFFGSKVRIPVVASIVDKHLSHPVKD